MLQKFVIKVKFLGFNKILISFRMKRSFGTYGVTRLVCLNESESNYKGIGLAFYCIFYFNITSQGYIISCTFYKTFCKQAVIGLHSFVLRFKLMLFEIIELN